MKCLIALCSKKKAEEKCLALDMYRGGPWHVIRKNNNDNIDIYVLSAKYKLMNVKTTEIEPYNLLMDDVDLEEMKKDASWDKIDFNKYDQILVSVGGTYMTVVPDKFFNSDKVKFTSKRFLRAFKEIKEFMSEDTLETIKEGENEKQKNISDF